MLKVLGMVLTCLCVSVPAHAVDGLVWNWDKPKRFLLISDVNAPEFLLWQAEFNYQARVFKWRTNIVASCVPSDVGKKTALVNCHIEDISLQATSLPGDMKNLPKVLEDLDAKLSGASLQLELSMDGRVRSVILRASIRNVVALQKSWKPCDSCWHVPLPLLTSKCRRKELMVEPALGFRSRP